MLTASEAESASSDVDAPSSRESGREAKTWSFSVLVRIEDGQTFSNLLEMRKKQLEPGDLSCFGIGDFMGMRTPFSTRVPKFRRLVSGGFCTRQNPHSAGIVETCVTREAENCCL